MFRDFISPQILKMEYGLANVMEQYETKYKARQLLGDIPDDSKIKQAKVINNSSRNKAKSSSIDGKSKGFLESLMGGCGNSIERPNNVVNLRDEIGNKRPK